MACCELNTTNFVNVATTTIPYAGEFGDKPLVQVIYYDGTSWVFMGIFTNIKIEPTQIVIDHGGLATGIVKLS